MTVNKQVKKTKPATRKRASVSRDKKETGLNFEQQAFVDEYLSMEKPVAWKAYQRVYRVSNVKACEAASSRLLSLAKVRKAIEAGQKARIQRIEYTQDQMFNRLLRMMTADVNEIMEVRRFNCRHCHGKDHLYQWKDEAEYQRVCDEIVADAPEGQIPKVPSCAGGYGFDERADPVAGCPNCHGDGRQDIHFKDTRFLSEGARMLYGGVELTQNGMKVKIHDQLAITQLLMRHMGMLDPKLTLKGDKENPLVSFLQQLPGALIKPVGED